MATKKVTVVVFPDEDGGYTAVMPYFSCGLVASGTCLTAQGWTVDEALNEARILIEGYLTSPDLKAATIWSTPAWRAWRCGSWRWMPGSRGRAFSASPLAGVELILIFDEV